MHYSGCETTDNTYPYLELIQQAFLPSTRNSSEAFIHLLNATHCRKFACSPEKRQTVLELSELSGGLQISVIPSLGEMLGSSMESYDYLKNYDEEENETCAIIHSSGTTGMRAPNTHP